MSSCEKGFKMNGREDSESEGMHHSFERLMTQNGNSDRLREAFLQELLKSDWKEQVDAHCLKIPQNVAFEFLNFGIFHQFLSYQT